MLRRQPMQRPHARGRGESPPSAPRTGRAAFAALAMMAVATTAAAQPAPPTEVEPTPATSPGLPPADQGSTPPAAPAAAPPPDPTAAASGAPSVPTAADVAGAPLPGDESGRVDRIDPGDGAGRHLGRGILFLPRAVFVVVFAPFRGAVWALERYQLQERTKQIFFNDEGTIGLYPTARIESGFGLNVGGRFVDRDLVGEGEKLSLAAGIGGRYSQIYHASLGSGRRLGQRVSLQIDGEYEQRPKDRFYGVGNLDDAELARFRQRIARVAAVLDVRTVGPLRALVSTAIKDVEFDRSETGEPIDEIYPPEALIGFEGIRHAYGELEVRWDTRRPATPWQPQAIFSAGWMAAAFAGRARALDGGASFWRVGADVQHFVALGDGPRVLAARLHVEAVDEASDEIAFSELPRLGGKTYLRGYPADRFRDRVATVATVEYQWDLTRIVSASLFVDAGRVSREVPDLDPDQLRVGYGVALEGHTNRSFLVRAMLASSIDGGVFLDIAFDPVFDLEARTVRR
jgi:hypothetical protein